MSLAISQALATGRHRGAASVLSGLPQRRTHRPQPASPGTAPDKVDGRWQVLPSPVSANMMESPKVPEGLTSQPSAGIVSLPARDTWAEPASPRTDPAVGNCIWGGCRLARCLEIWATSRLSPAPHACGAEKCPSCALPLACIKRRRKPTGVWKVWLFLPAVGKLF